MRSKIGQKISLAFFVLLILIAVMVVITFRGFNTITKSLDEMEQESVKRGAAGNLRFSITQLLMTSNDYIITEKDYYKREYNRLNLKVDISYKQFTQLKLTDEERKLTEKILQCIDSIRTYSEQIFSITNPRQTPKVWKLMETMDYQFGEDVNMKTTQIFDGISYRIDKLRIQAAEDKERVSNLIYIMISFAVLISILVSYLTVQRITKPILTVTNAANGIANGDYSQRPNVKTNDEIAVLAESFSSMAESIQKSQKELKESKKLTEAIIATVPVGLLVYDSQGKILSINNSFCNFFDLFQNITLYQNIKSLFDVLTITEECKNHIFSHEPVQNVECCLSDAKKGIRIFNLTIFPLQQTDGENLLMLEDITERKHDEEKLKIIHTAIEQAAECVFITDRNGVIQYVNKAFEEYCGYSKEEAIGQTPRILKSDHHPEKFFKNLWDTILAGNVFSGMIVNKHKNGELVYEEKIITPVKDEKNNITHFVATAKIITEQILTKKALKKSEERLQTALKNSPIIVYNQDTDLRYTYIFNQPLHMSEKQILGKTDFDLQTPEEAEEATTLKIKVLETGVGIRKEIERTINGEKRFYDLILEPLRDDDNTIIGITGAAVDITKSKLAEQEIISQRNKFEQLFENSPVAIVLLDEKDRVVHINESFTALFGYYLEEIKGKFLSDYIIPDELKEEAELYSELTRKGSQINKESYRKGKDGTLVFVNIIGIPVIINEKLLGIYGMYVDLTQRKEAEEKMKLAKELAEQSDKLKTEFLAQMSHEIRTPLNAIIGNVNFLNEIFSDEMNKEESDIFDGINLASKRITRTIDMILNSSELQISGYEPQFVNVDLNTDILQKLYKEHQLSAKQKGLEFIYKCELTETNITADEYSLFQMFDNFIDNALKYTKNGKVEILLDKNTSGNIIVEIKDTGIGISKEFLNKIFEPFTQEDHGYTRNYDGTGLGLSLTKKYCDINKAVIEIESNKNVGSTFRVIFSR